MLVKDEVNDPKIRRIAEEAISWAFQHGLVVASGTETAGQMFPCANRVVPDSISERRV